MYTLQSGQIENALRSGGINDASAKQMVQGLANCQQPLEHRGNVTLSAPVQNFFPGISPAPWTASSPQNVTFKDIFIDIPPWQNVPFTPLPYPEWPEWKDADYWDYPVLTAEGPARLGPVTSPRIDAQAIASRSIDNAGDLASGGNMQVGGNATIALDMTVNGNTTTKRRVRSYGPIYSYKQTNLANEIIVHGVPMAKQTMDVVADVTWDGSIFRKVMRTITFLGRVGTTGTSVIADCTA